MDGEFQIQREILQASTVRSVKTQKKHMYLHVFYSFFFFSGWGWSPGTHLLLGYTPWLKPQPSPLMFTSLFGVCEHMCGDVHRPEEGLGCGTLTINLIALSLTKSRATQATGKPRQSSCFFPRDARVTDAQRLHLAFCLRADVSNSGPHVCAVRTSFWAIRL